MKSVGPGCFGLEGGVDPMSGPPQEGLESWGSVYKYIKRYRFVDLNTSGLL